MNLFIIYYIQLQYYSDASVQVPQSWPHHCSASHLIASFCNAIRTSDESQCASTDLGTSAFKTFISLMCKWLFIPKHKAVYCVLMLTAASSTLSITSTHVTLTLLHNQRNKKKQRHTLCPTAAAISCSAPCWTASRNRSRGAADTEPRICSEKDKYQFHLHTSSYQTASIHVSKYVPSEHICSDVHDHQGEPGIDHTPDREGPAGWSDVGLMAGRHITCRGMEGTWKTTETVRSALSHH